jgi:hypothetical protein
MHGLSSRNLKYRRAFAAAWTYFDSPTTSPRLAFCSAVERTPFGCRCDSEGELVAVVGVHRPFVFHTSEAARIKLSRLNQKMLREVLVDRRPVRGQANAGPAPPPPPPALPPPPPTTAGQRLTDACVSLGLLAQGHILSVEMFRAFIPTHYASADAQRAANQAWWLEQAIAWAIHGSANVEECVRNAAGWGDRPLP